MNLFVEYCFDQWMRSMLIAYYWPNFVLGQQDEWIQMGITLNGAKPICKS